MILSDPSRGIVVQIFPPDFPFGGVQVQTPDTPIQLEIDSGSPVSSVFGRVGNIVADANDYALFYAPLGSGIPQGGLTGQSLVKLGVNDYDVGWASGAGTVTSVAAGNLSPLFTASVSDPTVDASISFALSTAPPKRFFGNPSLATATPSWNFVDFSDLSGSLDPSQGGLPAGGTAGQALVKQTSTNFDAIWVNRFSGTPATGNLAAFSGASVLTNVHNSLGAAGFIKVNPDDSFTMQLAANFLTSLGASTVGSNIFSLSNPGVISFIRINADNSITARTPAGVLTDLGVTAVGNALITLGSANSGGILIGNGTIFVSNALSGANVTASLNSSGVLTLTGLQTAAIANSAVTLAKIAPASANSMLLGSGTSGSGNPYSEITLGTGLSMSGTTLNVAGGGGGIPGGSDTQAQYNNAGAFGGMAGITFAGGVLSLKATLFQFVDFANATKTAVWDLSNIPPSTQVSIVVPNTASPVLVVPQSATSNNFITGISALGVLTAARPTISNLTNLSTTSLLVGSNASTAAVTELNLGAGLSISAGALTIGTLNQNTTGSAAGLSISGQTGILFFTGLASTNRIKTVRDAADTILELGGSYTPTGNWTNLNLVTPILGTPQSGNLANCTFPTLNQNTTGSAASLSISGQTGLMTFTGLASTNRIKTVRDAADTILELGGSYTPTGTWTSLNLVTPVLGTPASGNLANCTFPTLNQNTTGSAAKLTTARNINQVAFDGTAAIVSPAIGTAGQFNVSDGTNWGASGSTVGAEGSSTSGTAGTTVADLAAAASTQLVAWTCFCQQSNAANTQLTLTVTYSDATTFTITTSAAVATTILCNAAGLIDNQGHAVAGTPSKAVTEIKVITAGTGTGFRGATIAALQVPR